MSAPNARIRPATVLDAPDLAAVHLQAWRERYGDLLPEDVYAERAEHGPGQWEAMLADTAGPTTWIARRDGRAVGFAQATAPGAGEVRSLELTYLVVLAAEQGRRTGTHLLQLAIGDAPCQLWVLEGDERTIGFYGHHGFAPDGAHRPAFGGHLTEVRMLR
ncbi:GNAT family N-acetyltransferase [Georgenia alba]|uniref:GNAT family N-acetyltransferase n=1 Tax=Georgenia alba TaxID=2233858 RepID=A0ABW2QB62_9MICO